MIPTQQPAESPISPNGKPTLLGPDGKPIVDRNGFLLNHYRTFSALMNSINRTYRYTWDEAYKNSRENAMAMRRDVSLMEMLRERQLPVAELNWSVVPERETDQAQVEAARRVQRCIEAIPRFQQYRMSALEALWYGRYGVQSRFDYRELDGDSLFAPVAWKPVNGDKVQFDWDDHPLVMINTGQMHEYPPSEIRLTDRAPALWLRDPFYRSRFVIHKHEIEDADFYEGEMAGAVHGVGIRSRVYWAWWLRQEVLSWMMDWLERSGQGFTIFYWDLGNPEAKALAEDAAKKYGKYTALAWPRHIDHGGSGIERIEVPDSAGQAVQGAMAYFDSMIRRYIVGQSLSSQAESTGLGSSVADLHADTKHRIIRFDAANLDQSLTEDLVGPLHEWNNPGAGFRLFFKSSVDTPNPQERLDAASKAYSMGIELDAQEIRGFAGLSKPEEGAEVIKKAEPLPGQGEQDDEKLEFQRAGSPRRYEASFDPPQLPSIDLADPQVAAKTCAYFESLGMAKAEAVLLVKNLAHGI